ncbi:hypothetical protein SAMN05216350_101603 [Polaromonas sp. YR568]|uniref:hypothetical protein n=1 Tax=Polaromonas sp. YR568 TaxID=1855301 RepID=UPI0008EE69A5|nr:hypothetical protein [Polaromonas sp. YR568]SFU37488.1 hypothetical protein SAMN05216350_101603 [Polaromonas sp. YR568]
MRAIDALAVLGTLLGFYYFVLGISAGAHLMDTERAKSPGERLLLTIYLWSFDFSQFSDEGKKLCKQGNGVVGLAAAAWLAWAFLR